MTYNTKLPMLNKYGKFRNAIYTFQVVALEPKRRKSKIQSTQIQTNRNGKTNPTTGTTT